MSPCRIFLLPGTGADSRMYPDSWAELPNVVFLDWSSFGEIENLQEPASYFAKKYGISSADIVVGSSLGGMVACEISKIVPGVRLVLVGSALSKNEVSGFLAFLSPLVSVVSVDFVLRLIGKFPNDLADAFGKSNPDFIRSACLAIFKWDGGASPQSKVFRIHGKWDFVILVPDKVDLLLDCGHVASITMHKQCTDFIKSILTSR